MHNTDVLTASSDTLPDPADVPDGEAWAVNVNGQRRVGVRCHRAGKVDDRPWATSPSPDHEWWVTDPEVTLVSRLVPDVRRVIDRSEDLDKLPVGSIVIDEDGAPWKMIGRFETGGESVWNKGTINYGSKELIDRCSTVKLIYVPEVKA